LHDRPDPAASHADVGFFSAARDPFVWFRVSLPGHARLGAMDRRNSAGNPFLAGRPRDFTQGERPLGDLARRLAPHSLSVRGAVGSLTPVPPNPRLRPSSGLAKANGPLQVPATALPP